MVVLEVEVLVLDGLSNIRLSFIDSILVLGHKGVNLSLVVRHKCLHLLLVLVHSWCICGSWSIFGSGLVVRSSSRLAIGSSTCSETHILLADLTPTGVNAGGRLSCGNAPLLAGSDSLLSQAGLKVRDGEVSGRHARTVGSDGIGLSGSGHSSGGFSGQAAKAASRGGGSESSSCDDGDLGHDKLVGGMVLIECGCGNGNGSNIVITHRGKRQGEHEAQSRERWFELRNSY